MEGLLQHRLEQLQLGATVGKEAVDMASVIGRDPGDLGCKRLDIGRRAQLATAFEDEAVLRVEPLQLDVILEPLAARGEDLRQHLGIEEESGADVEAIATLDADRLGSAPDGLVLLEQGDFDALGRQQQGRSKASRTRADDGDLATSATSTRRYQRRSSCRLSKHANRPRCSAASARINARGRSGGSSGGISRPSKTPATRPIGAPPTPGIMLLPAVRRSLETL